MCNRQNWPFWEASVLCGAIACGAVAVVLAAVQRHERRLDTRHDAMELLLRRELPMENLDRYDTLISACRLASRAVPQSFGPEQFASSAPLPRLRRRLTEGAIVALRDVVKITPEEDAAWSALGWVYAVSGDTTEAAESEKTAISLYPYDYTSHVVLGAILERQRRDGEAAGEYGTAILLYPRLAMSSYWQAFQTRNPGLAQATMQGALNRLQQDPFLFDDVHRTQTRARLEMELGSFDQAAEIVYFLERELPNLSGTWEIQGELDERNGKLADAINDYDRAAFLDKVDPLPHERLALLELKVRDAHAAAEQILLAIKLNNTLESPAAFRHAVQYNRTPYLRDGKLPRRIVEETEPGFDFGTVAAQVITLANSLGDRSTIERMRAFEPGGETTSIYGDIELEDQ